MLADIQQVLADEFPSHASPPCAIQATVSLANDCLQDDLFVNQEELSDMSYLSDEPSASETSFDSLYQSAVQLRGGQVEDMCQLEPPHDVGQLRGGQLQDMCQLEPPQVVGQLLRWCNRRCYNVAFLNGKV